MSVQEVILSSDNFESVWDVVNSKKLHLELDSSYGWEKLIGEDNHAEFFDVMQVSSHIHKLCQRDMKKLDTNEIECGEKVCELFRSFWYQLAEELKKFSDAGGSQTLWLSAAARTNF